MTLISSEQLVKLVRRMKTDPRSSIDCSIVVKSPHGKILGSMKPVTTNLAKQVDILASLTRWRKMFMRYFLTQFTATTARTAKWLENVVLPSSDRVLFLILEDEGKPIGNFGVCSLTPNAAELDNLIRGERGGDPNLIFYSEIAMLSWLYWGIGINSVSLHVFSNNAKTIALHSSVGFAVAKKYRLNRILEGNETRFLIDSELGTPADFDYYEMTLDRNGFIATNNWAASLYEMPMRAWCNSAIGVGND